MFYRFLLIASLLQCVTSYRYFQDKIPNGRSVPNPCKPNKLWKGVGHFLIDGTGVRNPFGEDFQAAGNQWTEELCQKDSDGDGLTNGQELGDPDCKWKENAIPKRTDSLSHPGICDPWDSPTCFKKKMSHPKYTTQELWMREMCKADEFECEALDEPGMRNVSLRMTNVPVPAKETTYMCQIFDFTQVGDGDYHMTAVTPIIDNDYVLHHMVLAGCDDDQEVPDRPFECGMAATQKCIDFVSVWTVGLAGECYHPNTGIRMGKYGYKKVALQFHWNNPQKLASHVDSSGLVLHFTENKRTHDAMMLMTGSDYFHLPPRKEQIIVQSSCTGECTRTIMNGPIYITAAWNHMHYAGVKMNIEIKRNSQRLTYLTNDAIYSYDSPQVYEYKEEPLRLEPGDELITSCVFTTATRTLTTFFGDATSDEMCFGFLTVYPKQNLTASQCLATGGYSTCDTSQYPDCPFTINFIRTMEHTDLYKNVTTLCSPFSPCREECIEYMVELTKKHSCMRDENVWGLISRRLMYRDLGWDLAARMQSCAAEVHLKLNPPESGPGDSATSQTALSTLVLFLASAVLVWLQ